MRDLALLASNAALPPDAMSIDSRSESPIVWMPEASIPEASTALEIILCAMRVVSW